MGSKAKAAKLLAAAVLCFASPGWAQDEGDEEPKAQAPAADHEEPKEAPKADEPGKDAAKPDDHEAAKDAPKVDDAKDEAPKAEPAPASPAALDPDARDEFDIEDAKKAGWEVGEATSDAAAGLGVDGKDYELPLKDFEGISGLDEKELEAVREVTPAELGELDMDHKMSDAGKDQLEAQAEALAGLSPADIDRIAKMYLDVLRKKLRETQEKTHDKTVIKMREKNAQKIGTVASILGWLSLSGLLLLLMPLWAGKKYPGQGGKLFGYAALASGTMILSMLLFIGALVGMRVVQGSLAEHTNPQIVIQDATFDAADEHLDEIASMPGLIVVPLEQVATGEEESLGVAVLNNAMQFKEDFDAFKTVADAFKSVDWLFGYVAPALIILAVVLFLVNMKQIVAEIFRLPERAMRGEVAAADVVKGVMKRVGGEITATIATLGLLALVTVLTSIVMSIVAIPAMSMFVGQLLATLEYVFAEPSASKGYVYAGLGGILGFLVLALITIIAGTTLYVGKAQKIFRARFADGQPLSQHKAFFGWRSLGLAWILTLPVITLFAMSAVSNALIDAGTQGDKFDWFTALVPAPLALVGVFVVLFVAAFGLKALLAIVKYKVVVPAPAQVPQTYPQQRLAA